MEAAGEHSPSREGEDAANELFRRRTVLDGFNEGRPMEEVKGIVAVGQVR